MKPNLIPLIILLFFALISQAIIPVETRIQDSKKGEINHQKSPIYSTDSVSNCGNYTWLINGMTYNSSGTYYDTSINTQGSDTLRALVLSINPKPNASIIQGNQVVLCASDSLLLKTSLQTNENARWSYEAESGVSFDTIGRYPLTYLQESILVRSNNDIPYLLRYGESIMSVFIFINNSWTKVGNDVNNTLYPFYGPGEADIEFYNGKPVVVFHDIDDSVNPPIDIIESKIWNGTNWINFAPDLNIGGAVNLLIESNEVYLTVVTDSLTLYKHDGSNWAQMGNSKFKTYQFTGEAFDVSNGKPYLAFRQNNGDTLSVKYFENSTWKDLGPTSGLGTISGTNKVIEMKVINDSVFVSFNYNVSKFDGNTWVVESQFNGSLHVYNQKLYMSRKVNMSYPYSYAVMVYRRHNSVWNLLTDSVLLGDDAILYPHFDLKIEDGKIIWTYLDYKWGTAHSYQKFYQSSLKNDVSTSDSLMVTKSGLYILEVSNNSGCVSNDTINVLENLPDTSYQIATFCNSYTWLQNGINYNTPGIYYDTAVNIYGCDSIIALNLNFLVLSSIQTVHTCDSYTWIDGQTYTTSTNAPKDTLQTAQGCDSIVTLNLNITRLSSTEIIQACDSYTWIDGQTYTTSTNAPRDTLQSAQGCDSIVTLNLNITRLSSVEIIQACDSYTWIDGQTYTTSTNAPKDTLQTAQGCDSIVTLNLTITNLDGSVENGGAFLKANDPNAAYQWYNCSTNSIIVGETGRLFTPSQSGTYSLISSKLNCIDTSNCEVFTVPVSMSPRSGNRYKKVHVLFFSDSLFNNSGKEKAWLEKNGLIIRFTNLKFIHSSLMNANIKIPGQATLGLWDFHFMADSSISDTTFRTNYFTVNPIQKAICPEWGFQGDSLQVLLTTDQSFVTSSGTINKAWIRKSGVDIAIKGFQRNDNYSATGLLKIPTNANTGPWSVHVQDSMNGFGYNWLAFNVLPVNQTVQACNSYTWNGQNYNASQLLKDTISGISGRDSVIAINLVISQITSTVSSFNDSLVSDAQNVSYKWLDCNANYNPIAGATNKYFIVQSSGDYAVEIDNGICKDTSNCVNVLLTEIQENGKSSSFEIYPNPSNGNITLVDFAFNQSNQLVEIYDVTGNLVKSIRMSAQKNTIDICSMSDGIYFIRYKNQFKKIVKSH